MAKPERATYVVTFDVVAPDWDTLPFNDAFVEAVADAFAKEWWAVMEDGEWLTHEDGFGLVSIMGGEEGEDDFVRITR